MLSNRITRIKVIELGKPNKCIPNATINYNLDFHSLKRMVKLAIRLSPQDPLYEVEKILVIGNVNGKNSEELLLEEGEMEMVKTKIDSNFVWKM